MQRIDLEQSSADRKAAVDTDAREDAVKSVLFVCWGNICRSPAAVAVFKKYLSRQERVSQVRVESAGVCIDEWPGGIPLGMRWAAFRRGYLLRQPEARLVRRTDLNQFDLAIAMDGEILDALRVLHNRPKSKIVLLSEFLRPNSPSEVPDPMHHSLRTCNVVFDMLESACPGIASYLMRERILAGHESESETVSEELSTRDTFSADQVPEAKLAYPDAKAR